MKRWNGWGDEATLYPLPPAAADYLSEVVGPGEPTPDADFAAVLSTVPESRLRQPHPLITTAPAERLRHARGQSLPDWVALRSGQIGAYPDAVAYPLSDEDVRILIGYAKQNGARLIPYGGGSSVLGHINPLAADSPTLTLDLTRMNRLLTLDPLSNLATFEAGVRGPDLEAQLAARGYTLGHFPQSFEFSTLGGWIATRSTGQQSYHYGRIEPMFLGGHLETPRGALEVPVVPASAAGPDLRHLILGSEGRMGVITRATLRVRPLPRREHFSAVFFPSWQAGADAVRQMAQERLGLSMLRLSDPQETQTTLALSGRVKLAQLANRGLTLIGKGPDPCLLVFGVTGDPTAARLAAGRAAAVARAHGGLPMDVVIGEMWRKSRFLTPYLRNTLWERGYALDTLETALPWDKVLGCNAEIVAAIRAALDEFGERILVFSHLSHVYNEGASMYVTYLWRRSPDPAETEARWRKIKTTASQIIVRWGGTISHQHGVGIDHAPYLEAEKGALGIEAIRAALRVFDPDEMMNPGKLV